MGGPGLAKLGSFLSFWVSFLQTSPKEKRISILMVFSGWEEGRAPLVFASYQTVLFVAGPLANTKTMAVIKN